MCVHETIAGVTAGPWKSPGQALAGTVGVTGLDQLELGVP